MAFSASLSLARRRAIRAASSCRFAGCVPAKRVSLSSSYGASCRMDVGNFQQELAQQDTNKSLRAQIVTVVLPSPPMRTRTTVLLLFVLFLSSLAFAADTPDFTVKKIGDGVYAALGVDGGKAGSNAGFIVGTNGVIVVDTFTD